MPDPTGSGPEQERDTGRKQTIGLALTALGIVIPLLGDFTGSHAFQSLFFLVGALGGVFGLFLFSTAMGRSGFWCLLGLMPIFGPILALIMIGIVEVMEHGLRKFSSSPVVLKLSRGITVLILVGIFVGVPMSIVVPNFQFVQDVERQGEARAKLQGIYEAEMAFYEKHRRFGDFIEIGFPSLSQVANRYTYRIDASGSRGTLIPAHIGKLTPDNAIVSAGIRADGQGFTATATANLDGDDTLDQWHINDQKSWQVRDTNDVDSVSQRRNSFGLPRIWN